MFRLTRKIALQENIRLLSRFSKDVNQNSTVGRVPNANRFVKKNPAIIDEDVPIVIPLKYQDEYQSLDRTNRERMVLKFERIQEDQARTIAHNNDQITTEFFTINQRIQIYNLVRQAKMDYNTVARNFNVPVRIIPEVVTHTATMLNGGMPSVEDEIAMNQQAIENMNKSKWGFKTIDIYTKIVPEHTYTKTSQGKNNIKSKKQRIKHTIQDKDTFTEDLTHFKLEIASETSNISPF